MTTSLSTFDQLQLRGVWVVDTDTHAVLYSSRFGTHIERQHHIGASLANIPDGSIISAVLKDTGLKMADLTATSMGDYRGLLGLREQRQKEDFKRVQAGGEEAPAYHATDDAFLESLLDRVAASSDVEGGVSFFDACAERIRAVNAGVTQYPQVSSHPVSPSRADPSTADPTASTAPPMPSSSSTTNAIPPFYPDMLRAGQHLYSRAFMSPNVCEIVTVERPLDKQASEAATLSAGIRAELGAADGLVDDEGDAASKARTHRGDLVDIGPFVVLSGKRATSISATVEEVYNATGMRPRTRVDPELFTMTLEDDEDDLVDDNGHHGGEDDSLSRNVSFAGFASEIASRAKASSSRGGVQADGSPRRDPHRRHQAATKKLLTKFENHPIHDPLENIIIIVAPLIRGPTSLRSTPPTTAAASSETQIPVVSSTTVSQDNATISSIRQFMGPTVLRCFYFTRRWLLPFVDDTLLLRVTLPPPKHHRKEKTIPSSHSRGQLPSASIDPSRDNLDDQMDPDTTELITEATNVASSTLCGYQLTCARRVVTVVAWSRAVSAFMGEVLQRGMTKPILQAAAFYSIGFGSHSSNNPSPAERAHALHHLSVFPLPSNASSPHPINTNNALIGIVGNVCGYKKVGATSSSNTDGESSQGGRLIKSASESELPPPSKSTPTSASSPSSMSRRTLVNRGKPMSGATNISSPQSATDGTTRSLDTLKQLASQPTVMALSYPSPSSCAGGIAKGSAPVSLSGNKSAHLYSPKTQSSSPTSYRSGGGFSAMATSAAVAASQAAVAPIRSEAVAQVIASLAPCTLYRSFEQAALEMGNEPYALPSRSATVTNNKSGGGVDVSRNQRVLPEATSFAIMALSNQLRTSSPAVTRTSSSTNDIEASVATAAKRQLHIYTEELVAGSLYGREENNHLRLTTRILAEPPAHGFSPMHIKALADIKALGGGRGLPSNRRRTAAEAFLALASGSSTTTTSDNNNSSQSSQSPSTTIQSPVGDHHQQPGNVASPIPLKPLPAGLEDVEDITVCLLGGVGPNQQKDLISPYTWSCEALLGAGGAGSGSASSLMPTDAATHANPNIGDTVLFTDPGVVSAALNSLLSHPLPTPLNAALVSTTDGVKDLSGATGASGNKKSYVGQGVKSMVAAVALAKYVSSGDWSHPATQPNLPDPIDLLHLPARYAVLTSQTSYPPMAMLACDKLFDVLHARSMQASTALAAGVDYDDEEGNAVPGSSLPRSLFARQQGVNSVYSGTENSNSGPSGDSAAERYDASAARRSILPTKTTLMKGGRDGAGGASSSVDVREASTSMLEPLTIAAYKRDINLQAAKTPLRNGTISHGLKGSYSLVPVLDAGQLRALLASTDFSEGMCPQSRGEVRKHSKDEARANHDWVENLLDVQGHVCYQLELELTLDIGTVPTADIGKLEVVLQMLDAVSVLCYQCTSTMRPPSANSTNNADGSTPANDGGPLQFGSPLVSSSITQLSGGDRLLWSIGGGLLDVKNGTSFFLRGLVISDVSARPAAAKLPTFAARNTSSAVGGGFNGGDEGGNEGDDGYDDYRSAYFEDDPQSQHPGRRMANPATKNVTEEEIIAAVTVYSAASVHFSLLVERPFLPGSILAAHPFIVAKHLLDTRAAVGTSHHTSPTSSTTPTIGGKRYEDTIPKDVDDIHQALRSLSFAGSGVSTANAMINSIYRVGLPRRPHIKYRESEAVWASSNCTQPHPISAAVVVRSDPEAGFTLWNYGGGGGSR